VNHQGRFGIPEEEHMSGIDTARIAHQRIVAAGGRA